MKRLLTLSIALLVTSACPGRGVDPCLSVSCGPGHCVDDQGQAACACDTGFEAHGLTCVPPQTVPGVCQPNPCKDTGLPACTEVLGIAVCGCPQGQLQINGACVSQTACTPNPCMGKPHQATCHAMGAQATCLCDPGYGPDGDHCTAEPVFDCGKQHTGPLEDSYEPDECPSLAKTLDLDAASPQLRSLQTASDVDWLALSLVKNHIAKVTLTGASSLPLYVDVYAADGVTPIAADHRGLSSVEVRFVAVADGTHFVRVRGLRLSDTGDYTAAATDLGADDYVGSTAAALELASGGTFSGAVQFQGDQDVVKVSLAGAHSYSVTLGTTTATNLKLELLDSSSQVLATLDRGTTTSVSSTLAFSKGPDVAYLRVSGKSAFDLGEFSATVADLGPDDHGDTAATATPILATGLVQTATFERPTDVDTFSFETVTSHIYAFTCNPPSGSAYNGCNLTLRNAAGAVLVQDTNGSTGLVTWEATGNEKLFVFAQQYSSYASSGAYSFKLEDLGPDDYPDTAAQGTPIAVGAPISGRIETVGDVDAFSFPVQAGHVYSVVCTPGTGLNTCSPTVTNPSGSSVGPSFLAVAGTYRIELRGSSYSVGSYSLLVTDGGTDDHPDTAAAATPITVGTPMSGITQYATDIDAFSFAPVVGHIYQVNCTSTSSYLCQLAVKDPNGTSVATTYNGTNVTAWFKATIAGKHAVLVSAYTGYSTAGAYTLTVTDVGVDDHGDTAATATAITLGAAATAGTIQFSYDKDVFSFSATAGGIYKFACTTSASYGCVLSAKDGGGIVVASSSYGLSTQAVFRTATAGTYTVEVSAYSTYQGAYSVQLSQGPADDHGDTPATATALTVGAAATAGELQFSGDKDVFAFTAVAGHIYKYSCASTSYYLCVMVVRNPAGTTLGTTSYSSATSFSFVAPTAGSYSVEVSGYSASSLGTYTVQATDLGTDDYGNTAAAAGALTLATPLNATFEFGGDVDWFAVTLAAATSYTATATGAYANLAIYASNGTTVVAPSVYQTRTFTTTTAGTYYVAVSGYYPTTTGAYVLNVQ